MKFVCDRCHTRYSISDEKVSGKVLKIRCKTCSNIIVVREQDDISARVAPRTEVESPKKLAVGAQGGASRPPTSSGATNIEWFVAIKGTQHGPMPRAKIEELFRGGQISARSYCWNENLDKWTRLRNLGEFSMLLQEPVAPPKRKPPPPPPHESGAEVVDLNKAREERKRESKKKPGPVLEDPFALAAAHGDSREPNVVTTSHGAPRESTRVFIMNAGLANRKAKHRVYGGVALVVVAILVTMSALDWMGTVEIPVLHSLLSAAAETLDVAEPVTRTERIAEQTDEELADLEAQLLRCQLQKVDCPSLKKKLTKKRARRKELAIKLGDDLFQKRVDAIAAGGDLKKTGGTPADLASIESKSNEIKDVFKNDLKRSFKPLAKIETPAVSGGAGLTSEQIGAVVKQNKGAFTSCVQQAAKNGPIPEGKRKIILAIENTGRVSSAKFANRAVNAHEVGQCITRRARKWRFPSFVGESFEVDFSVILGVKL